MRFLSFVFFTLLLFITACGEDLPNGGDAVVNGSWQLERATRNNMETSLLDGLYFNFRDDGTLETNMMGNETDGTYTWEGTEIETLGISVPMTYTIKELTDSTLHLQSKLQGFQFGFELVRK